MLRSRFDIIGGAHGFFDHEVNFGPLKTAHALAITLGELRATDYSMDIKEILAESGDREYNLPRTHSP